MLTFSEGLKHVTSKPWFFTGILAGVLALNLVPIWSVTWLPMGDYGAHIELMDIVARYNSPNTSYAEVYQLPNILQPNMLSLYFAKLVGWAMSMDFAAKILVSLYAIGLPLSVLLVARVFGRSKWLTLLSCPMVFNAIFNVGFLNHLIALPLLFVTIAQSRRYAEHGGVLRGVGLAATLLALYFAHVIPFLIASGISIAFIALFANRWRNALRGWPLLVPLPLILLWVWRMFIALEATESGSTFGSEHGLNLVFTPWILLIKNIHTWGMEYFRDSVDEIVFGAIVFTWCILMALSWLGRRSAGPSFSSTANQTEAVPPDMPSGTPPGKLLGWLFWIRNHSLGALTLCCAAAYFAIPTRMHEMAIITERIVLIVLLLLCILPRLQFDRLVQRLALIPMVLIATIYPIAVQAEFSVFEEKQIGKLPQMIEALPERSRLAYIMYQLSNPLTHMGPLWHLPKAIHCVKNGGLTDDSFAARPYTPVQYQPGAKPFKLSSLGRSFLQSPHVSDYDHILVRSNSPPGGALRAKNLRLREHYGIWWLFDVVHTPIK
jgi:hypothetical protein